MVQTQMTLLGLNSAAGSPVGSAVGSAVDSAIRSAGSRFPDSLLCRPDWVP